MANPCYCFRLIAPLAVAFSLVSLATVIAKEGWTADQMSVPFPAETSEQQLLEQLRSGPPEEKVLACKQLAIYGSKAAVPEVAKLLSDERFASWARIALEAIPDEPADAALVEAAKNLQGKLLIGVINSLGARRSAQGVEQLAAHLEDGDDQVAAAAAVALGRIGNEHALHALKEAFHDSASPAVRSAIAEGGILCAERRLANGNADVAVKIYDVIRSADLPKQRIVEATRGAILARGEQGIPLLVENLQSPDKAMFQIALSTARELSGERVVEALVAQLSKTRPERASLIIYAIGDRKEAVLPPAVLQAATTGDTQVRLAAIELVGRLGDAAVVSTLLDVAAGDDEELAQAAKSALAGLPGEGVDARLAERLSSAAGKSQALVIELIGARRIEATPQLVVALRSDDQSIRRAALVALGETISPKDLSVLVREVVRARDDRQQAEEALRAASIRMPDRERAAAELAAAMSRSPTAAKVSLLRVLGAVGGEKALRTIAAAAKTGEVPLQDAATRELGQWMTADAAPHLLEIASADHKFKVRALRGYLRIARQLNMTDAQRLAMCRKALAVAERADERQLALEAMKRCESAEAVELASSLLSDEQLRDRAVEAAIFIGEKIKDKDPAAAKSAGEKALQAAPQGEFAERARALTSP
jgi:HEAT repeat protein